MDVFSKKINLESRSDSVSVYAIGDIHVGAPNFAKERLQKYIKYIKADKRPKVVVLLGDLCDAIVLKDAKRFTSANFSDEVLTGSPKTIRGNIANLAVNQARQVVKLLMPIKDFIIGSVRGNHEESVEKSAGLDLHSLVCEDLEIRNCGDIGFVCLNLTRGTQSKIIKIAFMHFASGGRTAGAGNNSLARCMNIFAADLVFQGHNHSPAVQRVVRIGASQQSRTGEPKATRNEQLGINVGSYLTAFAEGQDDYAQQRLFNPKEEILYRVNIKIVEDRSEGKSSAPRASLSVEELH